MSSSSDFIATLKHEHSRLERLIRIVDGGRWWTRDEPNALNVSSLHEKIELIKRAIDDIEQSIGQLGRDPRVGN